MLCLLLNQAQMHFYKEGGTGCLQLLNKGLKLDLKKGEDYYLSCLLSVENL